MIIDFKGHRIVAQNETIWLTNFQSKLLEFLYNNKKNVVTYEDVISYIYQTECDDSLRNSIRQHMASLRKKIGEYIKIKTVRDVGYIIEEDFK